MQGDKLDLYGLAEAFERGARGIEDLANRCLKPSTDHLGSRGQELSQQRTKQALAVLQQADRLLETVGVSSRDLRPHLFYPIVEHASMTTDEDLTRRWACLLACSATPQPVHISYPKILSELGGPEFRVLDVMYQWYRDHTSEIPRLACSFAPQNLRESARTSREEFRIIMTNLFRLALCLSEEVPKAGQRDIYLTPLGFDFAKTCRGPSAPSSSSPTG